MFLSFFSTTTLKDKIAFLFILFFACDTVTPFIGDHEGNTEEKKRITITSSLNKISTDQLGNRRRRKGGGAFYSWLLSPNF
jgi:hypothetical protein